MTVPVHKAFQVLVAAVALIGATAANAHADPVAAHGQIAFTSIDSNTGEPRVSIVDPDGTSARDLQLPAPAGRPRWSPDGRTLEVFSFSDLGLRPATVASDGSGFTILPAPGLPASMDISPCIWGPTEERILCEATDFGDDPSLNGIYSLRATDGGDPVRLTVNPYPPSGDFGGGDLPGDLSPDGTQFVFMRAMPGPDPSAPDQGQSGALFVGNLDGSGIRQITAYGLANSHDEGVAAWSPSGRHIAFGSEDGHLYTVRPDGAQLRRLELPDAGPSYAFTPSWSPSGSRLAFGLFTAADGNAALYTVRPDGSGLVQVTHTPDFVDFPDWSPRLRT
jgi:Tol biopolymer transport system component